MTDEGSRVAMLPERTKQQAPMKPASKRSCADPAAQILETAISEVIEVIQFPPPLRYPTGLNTVVLACRVIR